MRLIILMFLFLPTKDVRVTIDNCRTSTCDSIMIQDSTFYEWYYGMLLSYPFKNAKFFKIETNCNLIVKYEKFMFKCEKIIIYNGKVMFFKNNFIYKLTTINTIIYARRELY